MMSDHELHKKFNAYLNKMHSKPSIGELYERQIRYVYEIKGWLVEPFGILKGKNDLGRDLICRKKNKTLIIQAKCWSKTTIIHEKHLMQLAGSILYFIYKNKKSPQGVFVTTAKLSDRAKDVAKKLGIQHRNIKLDRNFPMIKCNINKKGKKRFFLPFDKYYDDVHIELNKGEVYAHTINEALKKGYTHVGKK